MSNGDPNYNFPSLLAPVIGMTSPFMYVFSIILLTRCPNSAAVPSLFGNSSILLKAAAALGGVAFPILVLKSVGARVSTLILYLARSLACSSQL